MSKLNAALDRGIEYLDSITEILPDKYNGYRDILTQLLDVMKEPEPTKYKRVSSSGSGREHEVENMWVKEDEPSEPEDNDGDNNFTAQSAFLITQAEVEEKLKPLMLKLEELKCMSIVSSPPVRVDISGILTAYEKTLSNFGVDHD